MNNGYTLSDLELQKEEFIKTEKGIQNEETTKQKQERKS